MDDLTVEEVCRACGLSRSSLNRLMGKELGTTVTAYLYRYRVTMAKKHLEFTDVPIKDIAARTGFKTVQHFSRVFAQYAGKSPAVFRREAVAARKGATL